MPDTNTTARPGPAIGGVEEVRGRFARAEQMEDAIARLTLAGFDRADLSLPETSPPPQRATPEAGADAPTSDIDLQQVRALGTGLAGSTGAMAAAGAAIALGGGVVAGVAAAAAVGVGVAAVTTGIGWGAQKVKDARLEDKADSGELLLSVRIASPERRTRATDILRTAGARLDS